jgi:hypothetical protein
MAPYIGLAGVLLGFTLGFAAQWWRERREARFAAALILGELVSNASVIRNIRSGSDLDMLLPVSRDAWERHGLLLLRILRGEPLTVVYRAYHGLNTFEYAAGWFQEKHNKVHALLDEEQRKDAELTPAQAEWLQRKAKFATVIDEQRDAFAADASRTAEQLEQAIDALRPHRPFED